MQPWTQAVKGEKTGNQTNKFVCSVHFDPSCFKVRAWKIGHKLCNDTVPSIFPSFPEYYQNQKAKRKPPQIRELAPCPSKVARTVVREHSYASNQEKAHEIVKQLKRDMKLSSKGESMSTIEIHLKYERFDKNLKEEKLV